MTRPLILGSTAGTLHGAPVVAIAGAALAGAFLVFTLSERKWRERWRVVPTFLREVPSGPYRGSRVVGGHFARAPRLVRVAAAASLAFAQLFLPALVLAMISMPFDGIAIALIPGILVTIATGSCGLLFLRRSPSVTKSARTTAVAALLSNVGLFVLCAVHVGYVEYDPNYGIREASNSIPAVAFVFALASTALAALILFTSRAHRVSLEWSPDVTGSTSGSSALE
jgi:hypothetical protein